jgi:hypothetical protein
MLTYRAKIERASELRSDAQRVGGGCRSVLAHRQVERLGGDIVLREIGGNVRDTGCQRHRHRGMRQIGRDQLFKIGHELMHTLGRQVQLEEFDCNQFLAPGVICTKHRSQRPRTNLMKNTKRSERVWGRGTLQRRLLCGRRLSLTWLTVSATL